MLERLRDAARAESFNRPIGERLPRHEYEDGSIALPTGPGLGVELDRDKLATYAEYYKRVGSYAYDRGEPKSVAFHDERWLGVGRGS